MIGKAGLSSDRRSRVSTKSDLPMGFWPGEEGMSMAMALIFMALAVPTIAAALSLSSTLSFDSNVKTGIAKGQYATMGGDQHALYRLLYEPGYAAALPVGVEDSYTLNVNAKPVTVGILKLSNPPGAAPPPSADNNRRLQTLIEVSPTVASPNTRTRFTYTIRVQNRDDEPENLTKIHEELPPGFSYVRGSTAGFLTSDPTIIGQRLAWALSNPKILQPRESVILYFEAEARVGVGNYCAEAWVEPGNLRTRTGKTAKIKVGSPPNDLCPGAAVRVHKAVDLDAAAGHESNSFTYTITVENTGTVVLNIRLLRDLLPLGFTYVTDSASGEITLMNPTLTLWQGRQRLDWIFASNVQIQPGATKTLVFRALATVVDGDNWNEVWVTFGEFADTIYTWPTAIVHGFGSFRVTATDGKNTTSSEIWTSTDSHIVKEWDLAR